MDFEDNNPLSVSGEEGPRLRAQSPDSAPQYVATNHPQRVVISEAGKSREGSSKGHITYTIRIGPHKNVRRRYSEFESFQKLLRRLYPCVVIPPIPEKHSIGAYAANPAHAHEDTKIIEHRQRTLANFLNRCVAIPQIKDSWLLERFLDPNTSWRELMQSDSVMKLPRSPLQAPPIDPASATPAHAFLPIPSATSSLKRRVSLKNPKLKDTNSTAASVTPKRSVEHLLRQSNGSSIDDLVPTADAEDETEVTATTQSPSSLVDNEVAAKEYERVIGNGLEKRARKINRHYTALAAEYADLGGQFNSFSLDSHGQFDKFAPAVEKVGQAVDQGYILTNKLVDKLSVEFTEPLAESAQMAVTARHILKYRKQRELQVQLVKDALAGQSKQLEELLKAESEAQRMNAYLHADDRINAATQGLSIHPSTAEAQLPAERDMFTEEEDLSKVDRDHVVDADGIHDRDHEFTDEHDHPQRLADDWRGASPEDLNQDTSHDNSGDTTSIQSGFDDSDDFVSEGTSKSDTLKPKVDKAFPPPASTTISAATPPQGKSSGASLKRGFKLPGLSHLNQAIHGMMDTDPQTNRRNNITRCKERIQQLTVALEVAEHDAEVAAREVSAEIARYNASKRGDIREFVRSFVKCHIEWAEKNLESWIEAKQAIANS